MISVVGVADGPADAGRGLLGSADVVAGGRRLLDQIADLRPPGAREIAIGGDVAASLDAIASAHAAGERVCVVASGDPGWFGIVRALAERFGSAALTVHPAPSAVALAFARLGLPWDDAVVASAHGRPVTAAARLAARAWKAAVLTAPDATPSAVGRLLLDLGATHEHAAICEHLGRPDERVTITDLAGLADGAWAALAVVVLWSGTGLAREKSLGWGLPEAAFTHRAAMITKAEVRALVVGLLDLPNAGADGAVLWDVGAGSASVAIECARVAPWIDAIAVERDPDAAESCRTNARRHQVGLRVCEAEAPGCLDGLPSPDRVFVGGGGVDVLRATRDRLRSGGVIVATFAALDRAAVAADLLGNLTQVAASRGRRLPDGGWRLEAANPTFVVWGRS